MNCTTSFKTHFYFSLQLIFYTMQNQAPTTPPSKPAADPPIYPERGSMKPATKKLAWKDLSTVLEPDDIYLDHTQVNSNGNFFKVQVFRIGGDAGWIYQWMDADTNEIVCQRTIYPWR